MEEIESKLEGTPLSVEELLKIPIFTEALKPQLEKNLGAVTLRKFKKGDVIFREGEEGSTAFYLVKGRVKVYLATPFSKVSTSAGSQKGFSGLMGKMKSFLTKTPEKGVVARAPRFIGIDAPVNLDYNNPVAELKEGDLFGEMTCLSLYPRSATVMALEDCEMLEMLRNILNVLQRNPEFKKKLDAEYRTRSLGTMLKSIPLFADVEESVIENLKQSVTFHSYNEGQTIFSEGDMVDGMYLVRRGFVKVSKKMPGGDIVLSYLPRGSYFGEMALMAMFADDKAVETHKRSATCTAMDPVELIKISQDDFSKIILHSATVLAQMRKTIQSRETANRYMTTVPTGGSLHSFLDQGLFQAQNLLVLDLDKCTRCDACSQACASTHDGVTRLIREGLRYENFLVATSCRQCADPMCMSGCPVGSIRRKETMEITIEDWCIGCSLCARSCPYGNINMHSFEEKEPDPKNPGQMKAVPKKKATTCDLCTDLGEPSCVYVCPHDAAHRVNPREFFSKGETTEFLKN